MSEPTIVGVYRAANAIVVEQLLEPALAAGWRTAWWAVDEVAPRLEAHTAGVGPGAEPQLLNRLLSSLGAANAPIVLAGDEVVFRRGDVVALVDLCERAGFGVAQPASWAGSDPSGLLGVAPRSRARETASVEGGSLVVVMPEWSVYVLPLPEAEAGIELDSVGLRARGCRLGVVDATPVERSAEPGEAAERARAGGEPEARSGGGGRVQPPLGTWRPWRRVPPWLASGAVDSAARPGATDPGGATILVDYWYSHAVGHVIEALRRCQGYQAADPSARISLVLNGASPVSLAQCVPFVQTVFGVRYSSFGTPSGDPMTGLRQLPRDWDHVVHHPAGHDEFHERFTGLRRYYEAADRHFRARLGVGVVGEPPPDYRPHQNLRLELPVRLRESAGTALAGRTGIAVMLAGSGKLRALYPSVTSWTLILDGLRRRFPDAVMVFVGRHGATGGGTTTGVPPDEVRTIMASCPGAIDAFDRPVLEQLAMVEACGLFLSPHTGFGFAALAVGTPWLTLSGGDWHEYFFNGVPFVSVLPKSKEYPAFVQSRTLPMIEADTDGEGPRTATMGIARIREDLDELVEGAAALLAGTLSYEAALADYFPRLLAAYRGDSSKIHTFEDIHRAYLPVTEATGPIV